MLYEQVARPDATVTEDIVSESSSMFVNAFRFVTPEFVKAVCDVVPFKTFASADWVEYVDAAVAVVKYELSDEVNALEDNAEDNA